jgi:hypothetical protein
MDTASYTADSVVQALQGNPDLQFNGISAIKCPFGPSHPDLHPHDCVGDPHNCSLCKNEVCKQRLSVYLKNGGPLLSVLNFKFMILTQMQGGSYVNGFIPENDSALVLLIENEHIKKEDLRVA